MKNIILLFLLSSLVSTAQKKNDLYILLPGDSHIYSEENGYRIKLYYKSADTRFNLDNYEFEILNTKSFDKLPLRDLGEAIAIDSIKINSDQLYLGSMAPCEIHEELALSNVYFVKEISSKGLTKRYRYWHALYRGTSKNWVESPQHHKGNWLED